MPVIIATMSHFIIKFIRIEPGLHQQTNPFNGKVCWQNCKWPFVAVSMFVCVYQDASGSQPETIKTPCVAN